MAFATKAVKRDYEHDADAAPIKRQKATYGGSHPFATVFADAAGDAYVFGNVKQQQNETAQPAPAPMDEDMEEWPAAPAAAAPVQLGSRSFSSGKEARYHTEIILGMANLGWPLQNYEHSLLLALLSRGCPQVLARGVQAIKVLTTNCPPGRSFHVVRIDGGIEEFSYLQCLRTVFPGDAKDLI